MKTLVIICLLASVFTFSEACSCIGGHPQRHFCDADFGRYLIVLFLFCFSSLLLSLKYFRYMVYFLLWNPSFVVCVREHGLLVLFLFVLYGFHRMWDTLCNKKDYFYLRYEFTFFFKRIKRKIERKASSNTQIEHRVKQLSMLSTNELTILLMHLSKNIPIRSSDISSN